jgi:hypothetical protein
MMKTTRVLNRKAFPSAPSIGIVRHLVWKTTLAAVLHLPAVAQTNVLTANYGNDRSNANLRETVLTTSNVKPVDFAKLGSFSVDGQIYAQPLYVNQLFISGRGIHNVVYTVTQHNSVYAYDADSAAVPNLLWHVNLGPSVPAATFGADYADIAPEIGILSTPVIDLQRSAIYVTAATLQKGSVVYRLHALDLATGAEKFCGPTVISVEKGAGEGGLAGGKIPIDPRWHIQRPGLLLVNNAVYVAFGSHGDSGVWHGWMVSYNASDLSKQSAVFMASPNGWGGALWQSGTGLAADSTGGVYAISGNGSYDGQTEFSESVLKFNGDLSINGWATPPNWSMLAQNDYELSAGALIPGTHSIVAGDKYGQLYFIDGDALAPLASGQSGNAQIIRGVQGGGIFNFALWPTGTSTNIYLPQQGTTVKSYQITTGILSKYPVSESAPTEATVPYVGMAISADGGKRGSGILWEITGNPRRRMHPATLHAFNAANLSEELWNSEMTGEDGVGSSVNFANPTVVNGKVYLATSDSVVVYGIRSASTVTQLRRSRSQDERLRASLDAELLSAQKGDARFHFPKTMEQGKDYIVTLEIGEPARLNVRDTPSRESMGMHPFHDVPQTTTMKAYLTTDSSIDCKVIGNPNGELSMVGGLTVFQWLVTPRSTGDHTLAWRLSAFLRNSRYLTSGHLGDGQEIIAIDGEEVIAVEFSSSYRWSQFRDTKAIDVLILLVGFGLRTLWDTLKKLFAATKKESAGERQPISTPSQHINSADASKVAGD